MYPIHSVFSKSLPYPKLRVPLATASLPKASRWGGKFLWNSRSREVPILSSKLRVERGKIKDLGDGVGNSFGIRRLRP